MGKQLSLFGNMPDASTPQAAENIPKHKNQTTSEKRIESAVLRPGRCPVCGGGGFHLKIEDHKWVRTCMKCLDVRMMD